MEKTIRVFLWFDKNNLLCVNGYTYVMILIVHVQNMKKPL